MAANTGQTGPDDIWLATLQEEVLEPALPSSTHITIYGYEVATPT